MKFDDKPKASTERQNISPQSAMDDYFHDMFSVVEEDPLKKLESEDETLALSRELKTYEKPIKRDYDDQPILPKRQRKEPVHHLNAPQFDEPNIVTGSVSPLIIPATFPKFAPVEVHTEALVDLNEKVQQAEIEAKVEAKVETRVETKVETKLETKLETKPEIKTKTETNIKNTLDTKTALALLTKQHAKLTTAQKQRLREKLKALSKTKKKQSVPVQPVVTKPVITKTVVSKPVIPKAKVQIKIPAEVELTQTSVSKIAVESTVKPSAQAQPLVSKNTLPDWASQRFECLLFSVAGLKLAVPLISLGAIYKIEKEFTPLVGRANWFMGLYHHLERNVRVIDTAQWVMPERCSDEVRSAYKFIIRLGGNDWGLACDAVHESIQLNPDQIKWRTERTKREWLFGTVIDHMCALIDVDAFTGSLEQQANKNPSIFLN